MTKAQKIEAYSMLLDGHTLKAIADHFGVSKQYIHKLFGGQQLTKSRVHKNLDNCIYPNLADAIIKKNWTLCELFEQLYECKSEEAYPNKPSYYAAVIQRKLNGGTAFLAWEWLRLSKVLETSLELLLVDSIPTEQKSQQKELSKR